VYAGDILEIKANVSGAPEPTVKWQKDGVPVGNWVMKQRQQFCVIAHRMWILLTYLALSS